jgi:hypothetical protein
VEGKRLGITLEDLQEAIAKHWSRLSSKRDAKTEQGRGGCEQ